MSSFIECLTKAMKVSGGDQRYMEIMNAERAVFNISKLYTGNPNTKFNIAMGKVFERFWTNIYVDRINCSKFRCAAIKLSCENHKTIIGYVYWCDNDKKPSYCTSSSPFNSCDGEYRGKMLRINEIEEPNELEIKLIECVSELIESEDIIVNVDYYPEGDKQMINYIKNSDITLKMIMFTVFDIYSHHTNEESMKTRISVRDKILNLFNKYYGITEINIRPNIINGQKMVPLRMREVLDPYNYNLPAWREIFITEYVQDLLVNFISPCVALYDTWTYIDEIDPSIFENPKIIQKYERSVELDETVSLIRGSRNAIKSMKKPADYYTNEMFAKLYEVIEYAQSYLMMSNVVLLHRFEHVGNTFDSLRSIGEGMTIFSDEDIAFKRLFELVYTIHCYHTKLGIVHTDLHANNITVSIPINFEEIAVGYHAAYITGPNYEHDTYIFPADPNISHIIDHSRCVLGPLVYKLIAKHRSEQYAIDFYREQANRILKMLYSYVPDYVETHQNEIKAAAIANLDSLFPILCAVDIIGLGRSFDYTMSGVECSEKVRSLSGKIEMLGRKYLITHLQHPTVTPEKYPAEIIFDEIFADYRYNATTEYKILEIYNQNNPMKYSATKIDMFPEWGNPNILEAAKKVYTVSERDDTDVIVIADKVKTQQEKLDGHPVNTVSSWID